MNVASILKELVSIKSVSADKNTCHALLKRVQTLTPSSQLLDTSNILVWGHTDLKTSRWLINTHIDVVPGDDALFQLSIRGDRAFGRGAADTKGSAAVLLNKATDWTDLAQKKRVTFMFVSDEEIGGVSTKDLLKTMSTLQGALFLEPTNMHIVTEAKGMLQVKILAAGVSTHGSRVWEGDNAIEKLVSSLIQFRLAHPTPTSETKNTTYNFSLIKGGTAINQVPNQAELWCDIRFNPTVKPATILSNLKSHFMSCEVLLVKNESPISCDRNTKLYRSTASSFIANSINPITQFEHATSDARHATALGIPALVIGPIGSGLHSNREWVSLKSLEKLSNILDHWISNI